MAEVIVETEEESGQGWKFSIVIRPEAETETTRRIEMTLSWADYNHWSTGTRSPSVIAAEVVRFFLTQLETVDDLPPRFDASIIRRRFDGVDDALRGA